MILIHRNPQIPDMIWNADRPEFLQGGLCFLNGGESYEDTVKAHALYRGTDAANL